MSNIINSDRSKDIAWGILRALLIIGGVLILLWFLYSIKVVFIYIGAAGVISLIGRPFVIFFKERLKMTNTVATLTTLTIFVLLLASVLYTIIPVVLTQAQNLQKIDLEEVRSNLDLLNTDVKNYFGIQRFDIYEQIQNLEFVRNFNAGLIPVIVNNVVSMIGNTLIGIFSTLFIAFFLLKDSRLLVEGILVFARKGNESQFLRAFTKIKTLLSRYFIGLVLQVAILFVIYLVTMLSTDTRNAFTIAFFLALLNLIPYLGPLIGYVLAVGFVVSDTLGLSFQEVVLPKIIIVSIGYAIAQLIDNFFNQPLIFGKSVKSHPLEIFIIILIAGILFGVIGLILAVPTYTAIKVISKEFLSEYKIVQKLTYNL